VIHHAHQRQPLVIGVALEDLDDVVRGDLAAQVQPVLDAQQALVGALAQRGDGRVLGP
jgi:hypothetical protein